METNEELTILIKEFNNGDKDSFVQIIGSVKAAVYKVIYAIIGNEENSIEVFDEVVYKSYTNLHTLKHPEFFKTWITRIAINESKNFLKKDSKVICMEDYRQEKLISDAHINIDERIDFENILNKLDVDMRSILIMKFYMNFTFEEIASSMQKPTSTIKTLYYKTLDNLKELLNVSSKEVGNNE